MGAPPRPRATLSPFIHTQQHIHSQSTDPLHREDGASEGGAAFASAHVQTGGRQAGPHATGYPRQPAPPPKLTGAFGSTVSPTPRQEGSTRHSPQLKGPGERAGPRAVWGKHLQGRGGKATAPGRLCGPGRLLVPLLPALAPGADQAESTAHSAFLLLSLHTQPPVPRERKGHGERSERGTQKGPGWPAACPAVSRP